MPTFKVGDLVKLKDDRWRGGRRPTTTGVVVLTPPGTSPLIAWDNWDGGHNGLECRYDTPVRNLWFTPAGWLEPVAAQLELFEMRAFEVRRVA